jgi:hypothetical protein
LKSGRLFLDTFSGSALDKILSIEDVRDLGRWLEANFSVKRPPGWSRWWRSSRR